MKQIKLYLYGRIIRNMEQTIKDISIQAIAHKYPFMIGLEEDFLLNDIRHKEEFNSGDYPLDYPIRLDGIAICICRKGNGYVNLNLRQHHIKDNTLFICAPNDIIQVPEQKNEPIFVETIFISTHFLKEMYISLSTFVPFFMSVKENPTYQLTEEEINELDRIYQLLKEEVGKPDNFNKEILRNVMAAYLYKLGSILYKKAPELQTEELKLPKREEILFNDFIRLLKEYHKTERRVDFYAEKLYLTPKHFSSVIKRVSGKTAGKWIDDYVILEAKTLLRYSPMSIQEVAFYLNFANASFFGKYFKHHTGMSPSEYKAG